MTEQFEITDRTRMRRKASRATYDRSTIYSIFDEALIAAVAVSLDGRPQVQPMIHVRVDDSLILHGLATNRLLNAIAAGAEACINVAIIDALALARRIEDHSMHYRSATVYGRGRRIDDEQQKQLLMGYVFTSLVRSKRIERLPPLQPGYLKGTMVVVVPIEEAVGKVNEAVETGEGQAEVWSGLLPLRTRFGPPIPDERTRGEGLKADEEIGAYSRGES